jgi:ureidoglycolate lyase
MISLRARPLTEAAFAPFGTVVTYNPGAPRFGLIRELENHRDTARAHLDFATIAARTLPFAAQVMERHPYSSQTFIPIEVARYLILVAPPSHSAEPDMARAQAFIAESRQCITYRAGTWHHPATALDRDGFFAMLTWRAGNAGDEEFFSLAEPVEIFAEAGHVS